MLRLSALLGIAIITLVPATAAAGSTLFVEVGPGTTSVSTTGMTARHVHDATARSLEGAVILGGGPVGRAFYVDPEIVEVARVDGEVRCTVSKILSTQGHIRPFLEARGSVVVSNPRASSDADCVVAAVNGLVTTEVLPALRREADQ